MILGGALIGSGMVMELHEGDYLYGSGDVRFTVEKLIETREEWGCEWAILSGTEKSPHGPWRPRRLQVRVTALKTALALT